MSLTFVPVVAVPARNEAERLPGLLAALSEQRPWAGAPQRLPVVVVVNNTSDDTVDVVEGLRPKLPNLDVHLFNAVFPVETAHVGSARRLAMDEAARLVGGRPGGVILTTDADAIPAGDWVIQNLQAIARGADIVGGRIVGDPEEEALLGEGFQRRAQKYAAFGALCDELASIIDPIPYDPWPRHQDHTGGSLAVRADVYAAVGGLPAFPFREDLGLVSRVVGQGYRLVHANDVWVTVSARTEGRAPGGMADCVKTWVADEAAAKPIVVEHPERVEERLIRRHALRMLAGTSQTEARSTLERLGIGTFDGEIETDPSGIARLIDALAGHDLDAAGDTPIDIAISDLVRRIGQLREARDAA